jgi:cytochrome c oxidase subunit 1
MSDSHDSGHGSEEMGFFRKYLWSTNHKTIGKQFLVTSLVFLFVAGFLALSLRWQIAFPGKPLPIVGKHVFATASERETAEKLDPLREAILKLAPAQKEKIERAFAIFDADTLIKEVLEPLPAGTDLEKTVGKELLQEIAGHGKPLPDLKAFKSLPAGILATSKGLGSVKPEQFTGLTSVHGLLMIFFVVIPILVGAFGNFLIPLHIGTHDMAFPVLNAASYWVFWLACIIALFGLLSPDPTTGAFNPAAAGWTMYAPLSAVPWSSPGNSTGMTCVLLAAILVGFSSIMGAVNYLTTILKMRAPGLTMWRLPLTTWAQFITAVLQLLATPVLAGALIMLTCDRLLGTSFFVPGNLDVSGKAVEHSGGSVLMWQHIFWFYSHPAVYILVLPAMGIASDLLAVGARKPIFGYKAMVYSIAGIAGLGFIVWAHHMFISGMKPGLGTAFMISTMMIALPSSIKVFNWLGTLWKGSIRFDVPTLCALSFVSMFIIGGLSGIFMAATPVDIFIHDTYYIVAHFHYVVFGGSLFSVFGGIFFWFPKMFGRMMNATLGKIHWFLTFVFFNATFFPMHIIGAGGHMRRIATLMEYEWLKPFQGWNRMITVSAFILGFSQLIFIFNFFWSMYKGPKAEANPWQSNTLEWTVPSPAPEHNYTPVPTVHHGPYEYGQTAEKDWQAQTEQGGSTAPAH